MTLQQQLDDARAKYHALITGGQAVSMSHEGRSITFQPAEASKLLSYIENLESRLGTTSARRGGPARVC